MWTRFLAFSVLTMLVSALKLMHNPFISTRRNNFANFQTNNENSIGNSDLFDTKKFHHVEFYTGESIATASRFLMSLGMEIAAKSDLSTQNPLHTSYMIQSGDVKFVFTSPYGDINNAVTYEKIRCIPGFQPSLARDFIVRHGLGVRAVAIEVQNVTHAYEMLISNGGVSVLSPHIWEEDDEQNKGYVSIAEVQLYGDTVLRLINLDHFHGTFLPYFQSMTLSNKKKTPDMGFFGINRIDHVVGNLWELAPVVQRIQNMTVSLLEIHSDLS
jgi:4-hydroxyphenylpyruvate dioxygenase